MVFTCLLGEPSCDWFNCILAGAIILLPFVFLLVLGHIVTGAAKNPLKRKPQKSLRIEKAHVVIFGDGIRPVSVSEDELQEALNNGAKYVEPYSHRGFEYSNGPENIWVPDGYRVVED